MAEIGHKVRETLAIIQRSAATFLQLGTSPDHRILGSELDGNSEYILLARAGFAGADAALNVYELDIEEAGVGALAISGNRTESRRAGSVNGLLYGFIDKVTTAATPNDYGFRGKSDGVSNMHITSSWLMMLKLADLGSENFKYAADDTGDTTLSTTVEDGVSVELGPGNWLVFGYGKFHINSSSNQVRLQLDIGGVTRCVLKQAGEDVEDRRGFLLSTPITLTAATTVKVQYGTFIGTDPDLLSTRIFALKLDAFENHAFVYDTDPTTITTVDTDFTVQLLTHTSKTAAARNWAVVAEAMIDLNGLTSAGQYQIAIDRAGTQFIGETGSATKNVVQHSSQDQDPITVMGERANHADATDLDLDIIIANTDTGPDQSVVDESHITAFTWELAPFFPFYSRRKNTLLRM